MKKIEDGGCASHRCVKGICCKKYPTACVKLKQQLCANRCTHYSMNCNYNLPLWIDDTVYENKQN